MQYPNLELIEYQFRIALKGYDEYQKRLQKLIENPSDSTSAVFYKRMNIEAEVFLETWPSTALAFDRDKGGNPCFAGQAFTSAYTTVMHETHTDIYGVFVDGKMAYMVYDANEDFLNDLKNRRTCTLSEAMKRY